MFGVHWIGDGTVLESVGKFRQRPLYLCLTWQNEQEYQQFIEKNEKNKSDNKQKDKNKSEDGLKTAQVQQVAQTYFQRHCVY